MAKKETGKQRRARLIREHICTACGKRKARKKDGKWLTECAACAAYYAKWAAKKAGKPAKKKPARKRRAARKPAPIVTDIPYMPEPTTAQ
jgi:ribosome-binding protein aMBF1 (putative translation factor)